MKSILIVFVSAVMFASTSSAVDLVCSVPTSNVTTASELCESLRLELRVRASEWNNNVCATEYLRRGLVQGVGRRARRTFTATVRTAVGEAVRDFGSTWGVPLQALCGDGVLDQEFDEECDDGNKENGDGCDSSCLIE